jgi:hypothetical protein
MDATETHVDIFSVEPLAAGMPQTLIRRTQPDDPTIGAQVRSGWATYVHMSEPHTMADCPFAES